MTDDLLYWMKSGNAISGLRNGVRKLKTAKSFHRLLGFMICCVLICAALLGAGAKDPQQVTATVVREDQYGNLRLDLMWIALDYGDSVNVSFSGGYELEGIPFYPDFYGRHHTVILTDYFDTVSLGGIGYDFNNSAGVEAGETATITLERKGRYREEFEAYNVPSASVQALGQSDEAFRNAREITAGRIAEGRLYRSASPFDPKFGRVALMGRYLEEKGIRCILDLSDSREKLEGYGGLPANTAAMVAGDRVIPCAIGVDLSDPAAMETLGRGLAGMGEREGPYLVHCNLGRDRTGVVCALLEALCGAEYQEIADDYMLSYDMLHGIDMNPESLQYRLFKQRIDDQMNMIFGIPAEDLPESDLESAAEGFLARCGMTEEQIGRLKDRLTRAAE